MPPDSWSGNEVATSSSPTSRSTSAARSSRSCFGTPWISWPNATFSITVRCASRPKCWNTIETVWRRSSRSSAWSAAITSEPVMLIAPAVGSIRRISVRTSVDLPEPESPITTNTSPGQTCSEMSRTAIVQPVFSRSSARGSSASAEPIRRSARGPKIFQTPLASSSGGPERSTTWAGSARVPTAPSPFVPVVTGR